jgi:N-acetylglucosaminyldiphosphoundecaprenol N-acetyl-beta-D-mannosaminyltransferase
MKIDIEGVMVDNITKDIALRKIEEFVSTNQPHLIVTTYSEFVVFAHSDPEYKKILNNAALSLADGVGVLWAAKFLSLKANSKLHAAWQVVYTGASLVFNPGYSRTVLSEKISGSRFIWDIATLAEQKGFTLGLVGGFDEVAVITKKKLELKFPSLKVSIAESPQTFTDSVQKIAASNTDILLFAYQPPKQEKWLAEHLDLLNVKVAMGVGGTFDYIAGKRVKVPVFMQRVGLEWLWRLITQPWRIKRMWNAIAVFIAIVYNYKVKQQVL